MRLYYNPATKQLQKTPLHTSPQEKRLSKADAFRSFRDSLLQIILDQQAFLALSKRLRGTGIVSPKQKTGFQKVIPLNPDPLFELKSSYAGSFRMRAPAAGLTV